MRRRRLVVVGAVAAVMVVVALYGVHSARSVVLRQAACNSVRTYEKQTGPVQRIGIGNGSKTISVLGDSFSTGDTLRNRREAWPFRFATKIDAEVDVVAQGGTGYVNTGFCGDGSFAERAHTVPDDGSLLVLQGGLNDVTYAPRSVERAAQELLARFPDREVVVIGPVDAPATTGERAVDRALREAARESGARYLSTLGWSDIDFGPDRKHMSPAGHDLYAERVATALRR